MSLSIGIIGLPNVGKSTLFNALVKGSHAEAQNYPFCTIEPNIGIVEVPDERLKPLTDISKSLATIPTVVEFVDIAGLVKGAHKGEGLGNKFLSHIRECSAIAMVVRFFEDSKVIHVDNKVDPEDDIEVILTELQLADLQAVEKRLVSVEGEIKSGSKDAKKEKEIVEKIQELLSQGKSASELNLEVEDKDLIKHLNLLTIKPVLFIANCSESQLQNPSQCHSGLDPESIQIEKSILPASPVGGDPRVKPEDDKKCIQDDNEKNFIPISAKIESELNELSDKDKKEYLKELGIEDTGVQRLIKEAYKALGLITFFTSGEKETRAWTIENGAKAPQAAGAIHTDFERGFIAADVVKYQDFVDNSGWTGAKSKGLVKSEGKEYIIKDGDVCLFKFSV